MIMGRWLVVAGLALFAVPARADVSLPVSQPATVIAASVGVASAQALAAATGRRVLLAIDNESTTATIACTVDGTTAALNSAGSWTIGPGATRVWDGTMVPTGPVKCIASGASTPVTIEADETQ